ncbi:transmembrane protein 235 [Polypterus senegalus]|uniref:transmembrane protein 235 n=1 Tax=Polypterus senegalus TaxID=55291 RepID=UPI0019629F1A|nr:transmembrane protein 235 [Polypterus senegalus]
MKGRLGVVVLLAGLSGIGSFSFLATAIWSEYWYIIQVNKPNITDSGELDSHSGLWNNCEGKNACQPLICPFSANTTNLPDPWKLLITMRKAIVILLPLSLILLVFGGIFGLVGFLSKSFILLVVTGSYFIICSLFTLSGVSIYIAYSQLAYQESVRTFGPQRFAYVSISFGWSLAVAWLSFAMEVVTGLLLLMAAKITSP